MSFGKAVRLLHHYYRSGGIVEVLKRATDKVIRALHEQALTSKIAVTSA